MTDQRTYHILVIDSDPGQFFHAGGSSGVNGISADIAVDDNAAAVKMAGRSYDAILIDFNPASGRGLEYLYRICALQTGTPVIALVSRESESAAADVMQAGVSGFIVKIPGYAATLPAFLDDIINRYRSRQLETGSGRELSSYIYVLENLSEGVILTDASGRIRYVNHVINRLYHYNPGQLIGQDISALIKSAAQDELRSNIFMGGVKGWNGRLSLVAGSGEEMLALVSTMAILGADGKIRSYLFVSTDITRQKAAEESLRNLSMAVEQSPESIVITDAAGSIEFVNPRFTEITGYTFAEVKGSNPRVLQSGRTPLSVYEELWETILSGREWRGELLNRKKSGEFYWELASISAVKDDSGEITHFVAVKSDITERKRVEQEIRGLMESRSRLAAIVDSSEDAIIGKTLDGVITSWNHGAEQLYGFTSGEMIGKHITVIAPDDRKNEMPAILSRIICGEHIRHYQTVRMRKDGRSLNISLRVSPIVDDGGKIIGASSIARDITAQVEASEALREKNRELEIINTITSTLNSTLAIDDKLQNVLQNTMELVNADAGGIYLRNDDRSGELYLSTMLARSEEGRHVSYRQMLQHTASGEKGREPEFDILIASEVFGQDGFGALVPVYVGDNIMGLIALYSKAGYRNITNARRQLSSIGSQTGIAVNNFMLLKKIQDSSRYLGSIVNESPDPIVTTSATGVIVSFNKSASRLLKFPAGDVIGKSISSLLPVGKQINLDDRNSYVHEFSCKDGTIITLSASTSRLPVEGDLPGYIITLKDLSSISGFKVVPITEKVSDTDRIYHFDKGFIYIFDRSKDTNYMDVFADQVKHNVQGLCITRHNPKMIRQQYGLEKTPIVWLTGSDQSADEQCIKPENLTALNGTINKFLAEAKDGVVLLDGAEYLITRNSFDSFLKLLHVINDHVMLSTSILQLPIDPEAIEKQQYHHLITEVRQFSGQAGSNADDE